MKDEALNASKLQEAAANQLPTQLIPPGHGGALRGPRSPRGP